MKRKKDEFDIPDFNEVPSEFGKQKPGDYMFIRRASKDVPMPGLACDIKPSWDVENLDILRTRGRESWIVVTYSADQVYNYQSQSIRYDKAVEEVPSYVTPQSNGSTIYGFCSNLAEKGFWEVVVGGQGTATGIVLSPPSLTILCPRPFILSEFVTVTSDTTSYKWTQIAGSRTVIITPDNVQYPNIDIQASCFTSGCDSLTQGPIVIRVETDNALIFTDLIIFNRPTDFYYGLGYLGIQNADIAGKKVSIYYRVPDRSQTASVWAGEDILITWDPPMIDAQRVVLYRIQLLIPPYTDDQVISTSSTRLATIQSSKRYRIATDFNYLGSTTTSIGDPIFYNFPELNNGIIFADDSSNSLGYSFISSANNTVTFGNQVRDVTDDFFNMLGYSFISSSSATVTFGNQIRDVADDFFNLLGYSFILNSYQKVNLGGIVVG
jgi:hypothetical protein